MEREGHPMQEARIKNELMDHDWGTGWREMISKLKYVNYGYKAS